MPTPTTQPERQRCRHIHADGRRCGSPCLRGEAFCYFHHTSRKPIAKPQRRRSRHSAFDLPLPEDRTAIQLSIGEILRRIATNDVDPRRAGLLLYGLQIASTNLAQDRNQSRRQPSAAPPELPVEELTVDPILGPLAPPAPLVPPAADSKPSLIETLIERLRTRPKPEPIRKAGNIEIGNPEAGNPDPPQPVSPPSADPLPLAPFPFAPIVQPAVLPALQAADAAPRRPQRRRLRRKQMSNNLFSVPSSCLSFCVAFSRVSPVIPQGCVVALQASAGAVLTTSHASRIGSSAHR